MNHLQALLEQLRDKEAEAAIDAASSDPRTRAGVEAIVRNAIVDIPKIKEQYRNAVIRSVVLMTVTGKHSEEFAKVAEKFKTPILDFGKIASVLTERLLKRAVGDTYTSNAHFMFLDELAKIRLEYGIAQLPTPMINQALDGIYDTPTNIAIPRLISKNYGGSLYSVVTRRDIGNIALDDKFSGQLLPILVYNFSEKVDTRFLPEPTATFDASEPVDEKDVKKYLNDVRKLVNKKPGVKDVETN